MSRAAHCPRPLLLRVFSLLSGLTTPPPIRSIRVQNNLNIHAPHAKLPRVNHSGTADGNASVEPSKPTLALPAPLPETGKPVTAANGHKPGQFTGEIVKRTRPQTYRNVVSLLASGISDREIADRCRVSKNTVGAIRERESATIDAKKNDLAHRMLRISRDASEFVEDKLPKATLMQAAAVMGISADKAAELTQTPMVQVAVVNMPTPQDREERRAIHDRLDDIARRLNARKDSE
jgi:hypothetical protein